MAAHNTDTGPLEIGAPMDYAEHQKTYGNFLKLARYGTIGCIALMVAMAFGFFVGGKISGLIVFALVCAAGWLFL